MVFFLPESIQVVQRVLIQFRSIVGIINTKDFLLSTSKVLLGPWFSALPPVGIIKNTLFQKFSDYYYCTYGFNSAGQSRAIATTLVKKTLVITKLHNIYRIFQLASWIFINSSSIEKNTLD